MKINEIAFVCYAVTDIKRAQQFYEGILKLKPTSTWVKDNNNGFIEYDIGSGTLAIGAGAPNFLPGKQGPTIALEVDNFNDAIQELQDKKIPFLLEVQDTGVCNMAVIEDPDGNQLMIHKRKAK